MGDEEPEDIDPGAVGFITGSILLAGLMTFSVGMMGRRLYVGSVDGFLVQPGSMAVRRPVAVLVWRLCSLGLAIATLYLTFEGSGIGFALRFNTVWNYCLLTIYISLGTAVSVVLVRKDRAKATAAAATTVPTQAAIKDEEAGPAAAGEAPLNLTVGEKRLFTVHFLMGEVELPGALLVSVIYWAFLSGGSYDFTNMSQHALNSVVMVTDFFLASYIFDRAHWPIVSCFRWGID